MSEPVETVNAKFLSLLKCKISTLLLQAAIGKRIGCSSKDVLAPYLNISKFPHSDSILGLHSYDCAQPISPVAIVGEIENSDSPCPYQVLSNE